MPTDPQAEITALLAAAQGGDAGELVRRLYPLVYDQLARIAHHHRRGFRDDLSPGTASLVHQAYLKLVEQTGIDWRSRGQFFGLASRAMRSLLVDNARRAGRAKREGGRARVALDEAMLVSAARSEELLDLDRALDRLAATEERLARIVECRFFGGLTIEETAEALDLSPASVKRGWTVARAWLYRELAPPPGGPIAAERDGS
jgi:RNA polymerase sigma factor (TIGR02999 family)